MSGVMRSEVLSEVEGSDHCPIEMEVDMDRLGEEDDKRREQKIEMREEYVLRHFMLRGVAVGEKD